MNLTFDTSHIPARTSQEIGGARSSEGMRLTLVIHSLGCGGAERVMSVMANHWAARNREVTLITFDDGSQAPFYTLDRRVRRVALGLAGASRGLAAAIGANFKRMSVLRRALVESRPDAVISFLSRTNVVTLLATAGMSAPVIVSERIDPAAESQGLAWDSLRRLTYPHADKVVAQSERALAFFPQRVRERGLVVPNMVAAPPLEEDDTADFEMPARPLLASIGRLTRQKGFDVLLDSFARIKDRHPQWKLLILGEGEDRAQLEALCQRLGLKQSVLMPGRVKNPTSLLRRADIFVMSSRWEGFPNALCEAMACGLPVVSTDCPSGPREIIRHGIDGLLVPAEDPAAMARALDRLMSSANERIGLAARAADVVERFSVERVMKMWDEAICTARQTANHQREPETATQKI